MVKQIIKYSCEFNQYGGKNMTGQFRKLGLGASALSILGSIYIYFIHDGGSEMLGIFVGLWAPTLILIAKELDDAFEN